MVVKEMSEFFVVFYLQMHYSLWFLSMINIVFVTVGKH